MSEDEDDDTPRDRDGGTRTPPGDGDTDERRDEGSERRRDEGSGRRRDKDSTASDADNAPLSGLRANIEERRQRRRSSEPDVDEVFEEAGSEPVVDGEQVWNDLLDGQDEAGVLAFGEPVEGEPEDVTVIPSRVCHSCTYFGDPPELHCTHEGTTIRRMVDMDHYEVVDCPVVKKRSDLRD